MTTMVMFRGEQCWLETGYSLTKYDSVIMDSLPELLFELIPVESASIKGMQRRSLVRIGAFTFIPSSIDFSSSEWSVGVSNGQG